MDAEELQRRLVAFGVGVCREARRLPKDIVAEHIARQIVRSATSPAANYAEARAAESRTDFVHKIQVCLKELRETAVWLQFLHDLRSTGGEHGLTRECNALVAIFATSVRTARSPRRETGVAAQRAPNPQSQIVNP